MSATRAEELLRRRMELLRRRCPSCDQGYDDEPCTCLDDLAEVDEVEAELRGMGAEFV